MPEEEEQEFFMQSATRSAVEQGGIFMRENLENVYQAPPKQIDLVRAELAELNQQIAEIKIEPLENKVRKVISEAREKTKADLAEQNAKAEASLAQQYAEVAVLKENVARQLKIEAMRQKAIEQGRQLRLMEELELRKLMEESRRDTIVAESRRQKQKEEIQVAQRRADNEKREILKTRIASLQQKLVLMEEQEAERDAQAQERRAQMETRLQTSLKEMQAEYDNKVQTLKEKNEKDVIEKLATLEEKHKVALEEAEEYRHAIEERIFAMESNGKATLDELETEVEVAKLEPGQLPGVDDPEIMIDEPGVGLMGSTNPADWVSLGSYEVIVHEEKETLRDIVQKTVRQAEPFVGPWRIKWRLKKEHQDVLSEKFSLDAETTFDAFANYVSNFMRSHRGFLLTFNIFESERVLVITDEVSQ